MARIYFEVQVPVISGGTESWAVEANDPGGATLRTQLAGAHPVRTSAVLLDARNVKAHRFRVILNHGEQPRRLT